MPRALLTRAAHAILAQWQAIDRDYGSGRAAPATGHQLRQAEPPAHHAPAVLLVSAVCLVLPRFFGQEQSLERYPWLASMYAFLPYPELHGSAHWALFKLINYGLLPYLCMRWVLRRPLSDFGVRVVESRGSLQVYALMLAVIMPCVLIA